MKLILILTLVLVLISVFIAEGQRDITVGPGGDYSKIQDAINDASEGDIIWVMSGTYRENVDVNKAVSLEGWNTGNGYPTVDAGNRGSAITLSTEGIILEGFRVRNSNEAGVDVKSNDNRIVDIRASNNKYGILLKSSRAAETILDLAILDLLQSLTMNMEYISTHLIITSSSTSRPHTTITESTLNHLQVTKFREVILSIII